MPGWISSGSVSRSKRTEHFPDSVPAQLGDVPPDVEFGVAAAPWPA